MKFKNILFFPQIFSCLNEFRLLGMCPCALNVGMCKCPTFPQSKAYDYYTMT